MGPNLFEKNTKKVPIKIGMGIAIAIDFVFLFFFSGGAWAQGPQAAPPEKKMRKTKPMAMAMPMPILIGTFLHFFQKSSAPSSSAPSALFQGLYGCVGMLISIRNGYIVTRFRY